VAAVITVMTGLMYLSGRQAYRTGLYGESNVVLPVQIIGLPQEEITIAEALRDNAGYQTGIVGKWHLGGFVIYILLSFLYNSCI